jgi:iron complex outermembrane receptor protein
VEQPPDKLLRYCNNNRAAFLIPGVTYETVSVRSYRRALCARGWFNRIAQHSRRRARRANLGGGAANLGKIEVTGTRIKRAAIENAQPVLHISRQQIQQSGLVSVGTLLRRISSAGPSINRQFANGGTGAEHIDLRYLGTRRVLVLLNGHRLVLGGNASGTGIGTKLGLSEAADLSTVPTSIIDHIDVLKDGASAVYGTDAIAGVINIVTRKNFNGAEASAYVGGYENHDFDGLTQQYSATLGHSWDRGNITVNLSYNQSDEVDSNAREYSRPGIRGTGNLFKSISQRGEYIYTNPITGDSTPGHFLVTKKFYGSTHPTRADLRPVRDPEDRTSKGVTPSAERTPQNRLGVYFQGYYDITDHVRFNSTLIYNDRSSSQNLGSSFVEVEPGFVPRPGDAPIVLAKDNPFSPFDFDLSSDDVVILYHPDRSAPFTTKEDDRLLQFVGGFSGDFSVAGRNFNWDASFIYGNNAENSTSTGAYNTEHLRRALGSPSQCGPGTVHSNCVPYNLFGPNTQAATDYLFFKGVDQGQNSERIYNADINSADIVDLPAGPLGFALGYQHREQDGSVVPDSLTLAGLSDQNKVQPTSGSYDVNAVYGELNIPLLADLPGAKALSVDGQARHSNYSSFGGNTSERFGFRYQPIEDLLIRGTWSTGFRAPGINDLFGGFSDNFPAVTDPCEEHQYPDESAVVQQRCMRDGVPSGGYHGGAQIRTEQGGNRNLSPETSISRTAGFVYSPSWLPGFSLNADYYKIEVNNALVTLSSQDLFDACYLGGSQSFCNAITRNPRTGSPSQVLDLERNIARFNTNGYDIGIRYHFPATPFGDFTLAANETHVILFNETTPNFTGTGGFSTQGYVNTNPPGSVFPPDVPANKANLDIAWNYGNWSANYFVQFIEGTTQNCRTSTYFTSYRQQGLCSIPTDSHLTAKYRRRDQFYHDVQVAYNFASINTTLTAGVNNLFDRKPPKVYQDFTIDRFPGRFLYGRVTVTF